MAQKPGDELLHYRLIEKIGEGGMGVVWKAIDTTLDREVAIKILPGALAGDPQYLGRFKREAKILASLSHPGIASVYGVHEANDTNFIAMELVPGEDLSDRLARHRMFLDETVDVVRQIAAALEAANERGVVHRDLKPANVRIQPDGTVKVLDFGLARTLVDEARTAGDEMSTIAEATESGLILGTVSYMSPEQARGKPVDKRADIWALGCILYECLSGRRPFEGESAADTLAKVVSQEPDLTRLPGDTPSPLRHILHRCLVKDPRRRLRDAGEVRVALESPLVSSPGAPSVPPGSPQGLRPRLPWIVAAGLAAALVWAMVSRTPSVSEQPVSQWSIPVPAGARVGPPRPGGRFDYSRLVAVSPDGSRIVYTVQDESDQAVLYLREADDVEGDPIPGTLNARAPFFSPDGEWLGFLVDNTILKVAMTGGSPQPVCRIGVGRRSPVSFDADWTPDGTAIIYATNEGLWRVSADGGEPERLTRTDSERGEIGHYQPKVPPDGRGVLFTVTITPDSHLEYLSLEDLRREIVIEDAAQGVPVGDGRLVFARRGELFSVPYDAGSHRTTGTPISVLQNVYTVPGLGGAILTHFDVSRSGTLVYVPAALGETADELLWVDMEGNESVITSGPGTWVHPRLSPDGTRISADIHSANGMRDIYIYELARGQLQRLTHTGFTWESEWRPDGKEIATLSGAPAGFWSLFLVPTDFSEPPKLRHRSHHLIPGSWFSTGDTLLFTEWIDGGIWSIERKGTSDPALVIRSEGFERFPRLSPDEKWIAYVMDESGQREVFVEPFPGPGPKHKISIRGGGEPVWSPDGRTIFYREGDAMFAVDLAYTPAFTAGQPRILFRGAYDAAEVGHQHYDVSKDGTRFLMIRHGKPDGPYEVRVVLNWPRELPS